MLQIGTAAGIEQPASVDFEASKVIALGFGVRGKGRVAGVIVWVVY